VETARRLPTCKRRMKRKMSSQTNRKKRVRKST
jgi:hypothetical protein